MASSSAPSTPSAPSIPTPPVTIEGKFFWQDDRRFLINGVVYEPHHSNDSLIDPLDDDGLDDLERSIPLLKDLGVNTIFVFFIDINRKHDAAMSMLAEAGIYVLPCIAPFSRQYGASSVYGSYRLGLMDWYFKAVDEMTKYPNTLGLVVSCRAIAGPTDTSVAPILRAIVRDVKKYIRLASKKKNWRALPVGISAPDLKPSLKLQYEYFVSGPEKDAVDFFGFNDFTPVGQSPMQERRYNELIDIFAASPVPVYFSMYGNNAVSPRAFNETQALYCDFSMLSTFSGGFIYEFFQSSDTKSGLIDRTESRRGNIRFTKLPDFRSLRDRLRGSFMRLPPMKNNSPSSVDAGVRPNPPQQCNSWLAPMLKLPKSPVQWRYVEEAIDDSEWVDLSNDMLDDAVDNLETSFKERFNINDKS
ncbi:glycoside hydrolase family 72 protein [Annulohypoxylon moriforme]|nr:glycoside hydrolase family 72 protein [Annulohypoxylon moriforme]